MKIYFEIHKGNIMLTKFYLCEKPILLCAKEFY